MKIGVLALQGDVSEHLSAIKRAANNLNLNYTLIEVRTNKDLENLNALFIPGGESTTLLKLLEREQMIEPLKKVKNIFGTCAGVILLFKLNLIDIEVKRNAYGSQLDSFEKELDTKLGKINSIFIRAPKFIPNGGNTSVLAKNNEEPVAIEQKSNGNFYIACAFHPELSTTLFHEYFLKSIT